MAEKTLYLSVGQNGVIFRGRPNNQPNSAPLVPETSGVSDTLYQVAADNDPVNGGAFNTMISGDQGHIIKSSRLGDNAGTWVTVYTAPKSLYAMVYGNNTWIAAGLDDTILVSTDNGGSWTAKTSRSGNISWLWGAYGNGKFVLVGTNGKIIYSQDNGATWVKANSGTTNDLQAIAYSPDLNRFVAVGNNGTIVSVEG